MRSAPSNAPLDVLADCHRPLPRRLLHRLLDRLADPSAELGAADEQERDKPRHKTDHAYEGKVAGSWPPEARGPRDGDEQPGSNGDSKLPPHSALDVVTNRHGSLPRVSIGLPKLRPQ